MKKTMLLGLVLSTLFTVGFASPVKRTTAPPQLSKNLHATRPVLDSVESKNFTLISTDFTGVITFEKYNASWLGAFQVIPNYVRPENLPEAFYAVTITSTAVTFPVYVRITTPYTNTTWSIPYSGYQLPSSVFISDSWPTTLEIGSSL